MNVTKTTNLMWCLSMNRVYTASDRRTQQVFYFIKIIFVLCSYHNNANSEAYIQVFAASTQRHSQ